MFCEQISRVLAPPHFGQLKVTLGQSLLDPQKMNSHMSGLSWTLAACNAFRLASVKTSNGKLTPRSFKVACIPRPTDAATLPYQILLPHY